MARVPCAFSCSPEFLAAVDERAKSLGLKRSAYIVQVLRKELAERGQAFTIVAEQAGVYASQTGTDHGGHAKPRKRR
jgi:nitrate reductase assembly molybdenum cofactor insertion protein NarJ